MKRDLDQLSEQAFDVLIVGGGVQGAALAREAARRGLRTALVEKGDFGHATSANSLKILHGGLRYLQNLDFKRSTAFIPGPGSASRISRFSMPGCCQPAGARTEMAMTLCRTAILRLSTTPFPAA